MDELIVRCLCGDLSPEEEQALQAWKEQSEANAELFRKMEKVWMHAGALNAFRSVDVDADFELFKSKVGLAPKVVKHSFRQVMRRVAAVMIPALALVTAYTLYQTMPGFGKWEAFSTDEQVETIVLPDASEVSLNANSHLVYEKDLSGETRSLRLKGEGYFKVAKNPEQPFCVKVGDAEVKVLGTEFNIDEKKDEGVITLSVTEGLVLFSTSNMAVEVAAGETAVFADGEIDKRTLKSSNCIAWKTGQISFKQAPLQEVLETIKDHFTELTAIENKASNTELHITTSFINPSLEDVLVELRIHFKKKFEINDNKLVISD